MATMQAVEETYYTLSEIAEKLKVSYRTVYRLVQAGDLAAYKLKGEYRVADRDLNEFLEARRTPRSARPKPDRTEGEDA
jgi:excisionase family DNA binding protein